MTLGEFTMKYREEHGLSVRAFAEQCDVSAAYISNIEVGRAGGKKPVPSLDIYKKIAKGCRMDIDELVGYIEDEPVRVAKPEKEAKLNELLFLMAQMTEEQQAQLMSYAKFLAQGK